MNAPTMQRRHFQCVAQALRRSTPLARDGADAMRAWTRAVYGMADALSATNGGFKRDRFLSACGVQP